MKRFLALSALVLTLSGCLFSTSTVAPTVVHSKVASYGKYSGKQDSDIKAFLPDGVIVYPSMVERYDVMTALNAERPDTITIVGIAGIGGVKQPNPKKVFGVEKGDRFGIVKLPDGTYKMSYHTLMIFDRLKSNIDNENKI